jgi:hypothetical protein
VKATTLAGAVVARVGADAAGDDALCAAASDDAPANSNPAAVSVICMESGARDE